MADTDRWLTIPAGQSVCQRCDGEGQTDLDRVEGVPPELCCRCCGTGLEPSGDLKG